MTRYGERERDPQYMGWVKSQPCLLAREPAAGPCQGVIEADHAGDRPFGQKAPDVTCIPLCSKHHRDRTDVEGFFLGRTKDWLKAWRLQAIVGTQRRHAAWMEAEF